MPFALADFACNVEEFVERLCTGKHTAVVVGEDDIAGFDQEFTEASGA
jgi:hypothetical protein